MKVLFFANYSPLEPHGGGVCVKEIIKRLVKSDEVVLVSPYKERKFLCPKLKLFQSIKVPHLLTHNISHFYNLYKASKIIEKLKVDVILSQYSPYHYAAVSALIVSKLKHVPIVIRAEDVIPDQLSSEGIFSSYFMKYCYSQFTNGLTLQLGKGANRFLVVSSEAKELLIDKGYPISIVGVNPNGADTHLFTTKNKRNLKQKYGVDKIVLFAGGMQPADRTRTLIEAFPLVLKEHSSVLLLLVGEGPMTLRDKALSSIMGISDKVRFFSQIPHKDMPDVISNADVCIGPLRPTLENRLTIPMKIVEYMACGKPVISTQVSHDILKNGTTGIALQQASPKELATKISLILSDNMLARKLGRQARYLVEKEFTWDAIVERLDGYLRELADTQK